ncbi:uncharacterized protein LOC132704326 isoform X2 [Cylas formicarius]|uniref:uncharacterized protein LOC132704326 isoform X2 n=1 Tax=Cylas formicarius TaxID=197179 RepID=UPI002958580A|nr:uncharacterized protein LOC132704326 isoform X2 [Cylas formicarius]
MSKDTNPNERVFDDFEEYLLNYLGGSKKVALLLDYDGTLTPIVAHPDLAKIPAQTKTILKRLSELPDVFVAIVSGRNVDNVKDMVGLHNITYAGNHGLEVIFPTGERYTHQLPTEFDEQVKALIAGLEKSVVREGAWIENKGATLTFHFRATPEHLRPHIEKSAKEIMEHAGFKVSIAHCALEARPKVEWNKGTVVTMLLDKEYGKDEWQDNIKVIFAGDDNTDEDAMKVLRGKAATFRITNNSKITTHAEKLLSSTGSLVNILKFLENILEK